MSKYTMSLGEYLASGYDLPASFAQVTDFDDLFAGYYYNAEIGFETAELFEVRLAVKAEMVMPLYAARISAYESLLSSLGTPNKTITTNGTTSGTSNGTQTNGGQDTITRTGTDQTSHSATVNAGAQKRTRTDLPINASTATPSGVENSDAYTNSDSSTDTVTHNTTDTTAHGMSVTTNGSTSGTNTTTQMFTGLDINEQLALFNEYKSKVLNLKQALLDEFKTLFMTVY